LPFAERECLTGEGAFGMGQGALKEQLDIRGALIT
jgi:hypothetical protein